MKRRGRAPSSVREPIGTLNISHSTIKPRQTPHTNWQETYYTRDYGRTMQERFKFPYPAGVLTEQLSSRPQLRKENYEAEGTAVQEAG